MARVTVGYGLLVVVCIFLAAPAWAARVCSECGAANPDENNFCEACGSPLKPMVTCPECGATYPEGTISCTCGYAFLKPKTVTVTVVPAKATIYVNGVARGKGKAEVVLAPGEAVSVEGRLKGYGTQKRHLVYAEAPGQTKIALETLPVSARAGGPKKPAKEFALGVSVLTAGSDNVAFRLAADYALSVRWFVTGLASYALTGKPPFEKTGEEVIEEYSHDSYDMLHTYVGPSKDVEVAALGGGYLIRLNGISIRTSLVGGASYWRNGVWEELVEVREGNHNFTGLNDKGVTGVFGYYGELTAGFGFIWGNFNPRFLLGYAQTDRYGGVAISLDLAYFLF